MVNFKQLANADSLSIDQGRLVPIAKSALEAQQNHDSNVNNRLVEFKIMELLVDSKDYLSISHFSLVQRLAKQAGLIQQDNSDQSNHEELKQLICMLRNEIVYGEKIPCEDYSKLCKTFEQKYIQVQQPLSPQIEQVIETFAEIIQKPNESKHEQTEGNESDLNQDHNTNGNETGFENGPHSEDIVPVNDLIETKNDQLKFEQLVLPLNAGSPQKQASLNATKKIPEVVAFEKPKRVIKSLQPVKEPHSYFASAKTAAKIAGGVFVVGIVIFSVMSGASSLSSSNNAPVKPDPVLTPVPRPVPISQPVPAPMDIPTARIQQVVYQALTQEPKPKPLQAPVQVFEQIRQPVQKSAILEIPAPIFVPIPQSKLIPAPIPPCLPVSVQISEPILNLAPASLPKISVLSPKKLINKYDEQSQTPSQQGAHLFAGVSFIVLSGIVLQIIYSTGKCLARYCGKYSDEEFNDSQHTRQRDFSSGISSLGVTFKPSTSDVFNPSPSKVVIKEDNINESTSQYNRLVVWSPQKIKSPKGKTRNKPIDVENTANYIDRQIESLLEQYVQGYMVPQDKSSPERLDVSLGNVSPETCDEKWLKALMKTSDESETSDESGRSDEVQDNALIESDKAQDNALIETDEAHGTTLTSFDPDLVGKICGLLIRLED